MSDNVKFQLTQRQFGAEIENRILDAPEDVTSLPAGIGLAQSAAAEDGDYCLLAQGTLAFMGHLTRDIDETGDTIADHVFAGRLERPFKFGASVGIEAAIEIEAEGEDHLLLTGTGAITDALTAGTALLSFKDGKLYIAQEGDTPFYVLSAYLDPKGDADFRIRARRYNA